MITYIFSIKVDESKCYFKLADIITLMNTPI